MRLLRSSEDLSTGTCIYPIEKTASPKNTKARATSDGTMGNSEMVPKYHQAPNFSIIPPDCGGYLRLGSIITSISNADDEPINLDCRIDIPESKICHHRQNGFTATRLHMLNDSYAILARLMATKGLGGELRYAPERSNHDIYHFRSIDTIYFTPQQQYLVQSMNQEDVRDHIESTKYKAVYMITGLKIARGPSVRMSKGTKTVVNFEVGAQQPGGLPVELGPKLSVSRDARVELGFEDSDDFIFGIRVKKLAFKRHWLTRTIQGELTASDHKKGATMYDDSGDEHQQEDILDLGDEYEMELDTQTELRIKGVDGNGIGEIWILT